VKEHGAEFHRHARESYDGPLPRFVEEELRGYLRCGDFSRGFVLSFLFELSLMAATKPEVLPALARSHAEELARLVAWRERRATSSSCTAP
jgi:hypothetical protein